MRINKTQYSILQSLILLGLIAGLFYLSISVAHFAEKKAYLKPAKQSTLRIKSNES